MTKSTITREQLEEWVAQFDEDGGCDATDRQLEALIRQSLAAMDSEPVAYMYDCEDGTEYNGHNEFSGGGKGIPLYRHAQPAKGLELAGWQFKSVNGDWLGLIDEHGKNQAVREGCEVREVFAMADGVNDRDQVRREHAEWSQSTFGSVGPIGPLKHLSKEALEAAEQPGDLSEWADMQFLLWDAQRRAGVTDEQITQAMIDKLAVNKQRKWPEPKDGEPRLHIKEQPAPVVPQDVLEALQKVARIRLDMNDFDGDRRGIADCLGDAEEALIEVVNRRAAMLQAGTLTNENTRQVDELTMWIKRLVRSLKNANPDSKLPRDAMDYLTAKGLISLGDVLR